MGSPHYILNVQIFYYGLEVVKQTCNFSQVAYVLFNVWAQLWLLSSEMGKILFLGKWFKDDIQHFINSLIA